MAWKPTSVRQVRVITEALVTTDLPRTTASVRRAIQVSQSESSVLKTEKKYVQCSLDVQNMVCARTMVLTR